MHPRVEHETWGQVDFGDVAVGQTRRRTWVVRRGGRQDSSACKPRDLDPEHAADPIPCKQLAQRPEALARAKRIFARSLPKIRINEPDTKAD